MVDGNDDAEDFNKGVADWQGNVLQDLDIDNNGDSDTTDAPGSNNGDGDNNNQPATTHGTDHTDVTGDNNSGDTSNNNQGGTHGNNVDTGGSNRADHNPKVTTVAAASKDDGGGATTIVIIILVIILLGILMGSVYYCRKPNPNSTNKNLHSSFLNEAYADDDEVVASRSPYGHGDDSQA